MSVWLWALYRHLTTQRWKAWRRTLWTGIALTLSAYKSIWNGFPTGWYVTLSFQRQLLSSRFRNDSVLFYPTLEKRIGKRGRPKLHDGKIDFENLDTTRCTEYKVDKGRLYGLKAYSKALRRFVILAVWYPMDGRTDKWQLYFSTDEMQDAKEVLDFYRTRFQLEFRFRDAKQHAGMTNCQATEFRKPAFHFNASLTAINLAKAACKKMGMKFSISSCKSVIHNTYMLERFICVSGIEPNTQLIDKLFKELILFTAKAA